MTSRVLTIEPLHSRTKRKLNIAHTEGFLWLEEQKLMYWLIG